MALTVEQIERLLESAHEAQRKQDQIEGRLAQLEERKAELLAELSETYQIEADDLDAEIEKAEKELRGLAEEYGIEIDDT